MKIYCSYLLIALFFLAALPGQAQTKTLLGFDPNAADHEFALEQKFDEGLDAKTIDSLVKTLSARPHHLGSAADEANAHLIADLFRQWGYQVQIETYYVLFPTPKERLLEMTGPTPYKASLQEPALSEDATSGQTRDQLPTYNCYSPDGDVSAELVYVNYGVPEDYERLERLGISVKGKIVLAKYGHSWRGVKPKVAQEHGAIGCILYSDPLDDGYFQGDVYPKGAYKNAYGVQRGSVMDIPTYSGDPLTPGIPATKDAKRLDRKDVVNLLKIPVLPISYHDAEPLLRALEGPVAPDEWRGALPITYHIGPGKTQVHLKLAFNWDIVPLHDVIAKLPGSQWSDQWIIRGNHYDAWVNGASDPISGQAAMLDEAKAIGQLAATGWRPKRTLVFCAWDGEEEGLLGSTEWVEDHAAELQQKAIVYINSDGNGRGYLQAGGSHALEGFVNEVARDVTDPETQVSIAARKRARMLVDASNDHKLSKEMLDKNTFPLSALGTGSDYSPFLQHIGISSLDLGFGGEDGGGEYHSIYDSYDDYRRFKDPGAHYGVVLARTAGRATLRLADANLLPFDFRSFYETVQGYIAELVTIMDQSRAQATLEDRLFLEKDYTYASDPSKPLLPPPDHGDPPFIDFSPLLNALQGLNKAAHRLADSLPLTNLPSASLNLALAHAEQQLLDPSGLPRRAWYMHTIYAPGYYTGYGVKTLPGVREAIEQRNWKEAQEQIRVAAAAIDRLSTWLDRIKP